MACHKCLGPPAPSVATLGGENLHLGVHGVHLRCDGLKYGPPSATLVDCQVSLKSWISPAGERRSGLKMVRGRPLTS